jgi:hypothetical protein
MHGLAVPKRCATAALYYERAASAAFEFLMSRGAVNLKRTPTHPHRAYTLTATLSLSLCPLGVYVLAGGVPIPLHSDVLDVDTVTTIGEGDAKHLVGALSRARCLPCFFPLYIGFIP